MAQPHAAAQQPVAAVLSDEERDFVALVKSLNVAGLRRFLEDRPQFNCDLVSTPDFCSEPDDWGAFATALFWVFDDSPDGDEYSTWKQSNALTDLTRLLVRHGASLSRAYSADGMSLLHVFPRPHALLIELGADIHALDDDGDTPLHDATRFSTDIEVRAFLKAGARVNQQNYNGETALYVLLKEGMDGEHPLEKLRILLDAGASLLAGSVDGTTPLELLFADAENEEDTKKQLRGTAKPFADEEVLARLGGSLELAANVQTYLHSSPADLIVQLPSSKHLPVHRWLMSASSEKLRAMLSSGMKEVVEGVLTVQDAPEGAFERLFECAYGKPLPDLSWDDLASLTRLCDEYLMPRLKQRCQERLCSMLSSTNVVDSLVLADSAGLESLRLRSMHMIAAKRQKIIVTQRFAEAVRQFPELMSEALEHAVQSKKRKRSK